MDQSIRKWRERLDEESREWKCLKLIREVGRGMGIKDKLCQ